MHGLTAGPKKLVGWAAAVELANRKRIARGLPPVPPPARKPRTGRPRRR